uniref:Uncharacterized protein n=1 Tax=viral metagenome TaxID=1070528 RepID=A0A6M3IJH7_9ZZZZ
MGFAAAALGGLGAMGGGLVGMLPQIASIGGPLLEAFGGQQAGKAQQIELENQATIAEYNARLSEMQAEEERRKAGLEAEKQRKEARTFQAKQRALYGVSGVQMRGSPLAVLAETAGELELDRLRIIREGEFARSYQLSRASGQRLVAQAYKSKAESVGRGTSLSTVSTLLTSAPQIIGGIGGILKR